jgi:hypothetical protein
MNHYVAKNFFLWFELLFSLTDKLASAALSIIPCIKTWRMKHNTTDRELTADVF